MRTNRIGWRYLVASAAGHRLSTFRGLLRNRFREPLPLASLAAVVLAGSSVIETLPSREVRLPVPFGLDTADRRALAVRDVAAVPAQFVLELPRATLLGREGWVVHEGRVVDGIWQEAGAPANSLVPRGWLEDPVHLPGTTVSLLMPWLPNYYHWTVQAVPRFFAVADALGGRITEVDRWLIPATSPRSVHEWLDVLGVPAERRTEVASRRQQFLCDQLVVASVPGRNRWVPQWAVDRIRGALPGAGAAASSDRPGRRLLIHRADQDRRALLNADEVVQALTRRGFEVVDPSTLSLAQEAETFSAADVVVGVHGAGLTNLVFCRPGADVVEIMPRSLVYPTFVKLAEAAGVRHHLVLGLETRLPGPLRFPDPHADVVADVPRLTALVDALIAGRQGVW